MRIRLLFAILLLWLVEADVFQLPQLHKHLIVKRHCWTHTMITSAEFKKQIGKAFGSEMRKLGFKGTGFEYTKETDNFLYAIFIEGSRWGGQCTVGAAVHPKQIDRNSGGVFDFKKLKIYDYEFKLSLWDYARGERWEYRDSLEDNLNTLHKIIDRIKNKAIPTFSLFETNPNILDEFETSDLDNFHEIFTRKTGLSIATTEIRFAWAMTLIFENSNPTKAKQFAKYGYSKLSKEDKFFGKLDFKKVLRENNGA
jgi:hypothetical protein